MNENILTSRLSAKEKKTLISIYGNQVTMDNTIPKDFNRALKQGWKVESVTKYEDGTIAGMVLSAPRRSITIRNANLPKREMSEQYKAILKRSLESYRKNILAENKQD